MRIKSAWVGAIAIATLGCEKDMPPSLGPEDGGAPAVASSERPDGEGTEEYVAPDEGAEGEPEDEAREDTKAAPEDDHLTVATAAELVTAAIDAVMDPYADRVLTPPMPLSWPLDGKVAYYVYPLAPMEGAAVDTYQSKSPSHRAILDVTTREVTLEEIPKPKSLGAYQHTRVRTEEAVTKAEQALLDLAAGRVEQSKVHYLLVGYDKWFDKHGKVGADCRARVQAFADWAESWGRS